MRLKNILPALLIAVGLLGMAPWSASRANSHQIAVNVLLDVEPTEDVVAELASRAAVLDVMSEINGVVLCADESAMAGIAALPHVISLRIDRKTTVTPRDAARFVQPFAGGRSSFNQDAINVTDFGFSRTVDEDGDGVYVALIDTGLVPAWRSHLPKQRVNIGYARAFSELDRLGKGLGPGGSHAWESDPSSHATFLAGVILGFDVDDPMFSPQAQGPVEGAAPGVTLIPIRVTDDEERTSASIVSRALIYAASLKERSLNHHPLVVTLCVVSPNDQPMIRAAMNYAISRGLIVVVAAGNNGDEGMAYPAAYPEAISVGASGWTGQWQPGPDGIGANFWRADDVPDPTSAQDFFITDYSSRELPGQSLDVIAPGHLVFGPGQLPGGPPDHFFGTGTSASTPHVVGIVALMAQKRPALTQAEAEAILKATAVPIGPGCRTVLEPVTITTAFTYTYCWDANATGFGLVDARAALAATPD